jgi:predicted 3-demethylubiquinone-9 3-methyltransferase (glyoxalase superfamily)
MPITGHEITPCLWFDSQVEDAANAYVFAPCAERRVENVRRTP